MRIAFVGKGGSGKSTLTFLMSKYLEESKRRYLLVDADINVHQAYLHGVPHSDSQIVKDSVSEDILTYLKGSNTNIRDISQFRKSTPPGSGSKIINWDDAKDPFYTKYTTSLGSGALIEVGGYTEEKVSSTCYHAPLAVLENILSHSMDKETPVLLDMVAGTDAFANTLHMQVDLFVFVLDPTMRSIKVFKKYLALANAGKVSDRVFAVVNRLQSDEDLDFVKSQIPEDKVLGGIPQFTNPDVREIDLRNEENIKTVLQQILQLADEQMEDPTLRLRKLQDFHRTYIKSPFIVERFGDISGQIDESYSYE